MLNAIYTSLTGMMAYQQGLQVISNNVANMNTPGFKLTNPLFRDLIFQNGGILGRGMAGDRSSGAGVHVGDNAFTFTQGELRDTGNSLDAAIDGSGFFVLDQDGQRVYSRAGQFEFDPDGILVEKGSGAKVLVSTEDNASGYFDINPYRTYPPKTTTTVQLTGSLARGGTSSTFEIPKITVIDSGGGKTDLKVRFTRDAADPLHWKMEVIDTKAAVIGSGDLRFNADGTPATDANTVKITVKPTGTEPFDVVFSAGDPGTFAGITDIVGTTASQVQMLKQDGVELGAVTKTEFTDQGELKLTYSNGESKTLAKLLLAQFDAPEQLQTLGGSHFALVGTREPVYGTALTKGLGHIVGGKIELSNVDLTSQFTDLIIVQRGYQASSQITSVANEMMQQLLSSMNSR